MIPVKLKDIVEELSFQSDEVSSLLNTKTGEAPRSDTSRGA